MSSRWKRRSPSRNARSASTDLVVTADSVGDGAAPRRQTCCSIPQVSESVIVATSPGAASALAEAIAESLPTGWSVTEARTRSPCLSSVPVRTLRAPNSRAAVRASASGSGDGSLRARISSVAASTVCSEPTPSRFVLNVTTRSWPSLVSEESDTALSGITAIRSEPAATGAAAVFAVRAFATYTPAATTSAAAAATSGLRNLFTGGAVRPAIANGVVTDCTATAISRALCGRSFGSFASARMITSASACGTSARRASIDTGV